MRAGVWFQTRGCNQATTWTQEHRGMSHHCDCASVWGQHRTQRQTPALSYQRSVTPQTVQGVPLVRGGASDGVCAPLAPLTPLAPLVERGTSSEKIVFGKGMP